MRNETYEKKMSELLERCGEVTFLDFIDVCNELELPIFEVKTVYDKFSEPSIRKNTGMYESMEKYRNEMPNWSARAYDYVNDRPSYFLSYEGIENGDFVVRDGNDSCNLEWRFEVVGECVVVFSAVEFID